MPQALTVYAVGIFLENISELQRTYTQTLCSGYTF